MNLLYSVKLRMQWNSLLLWSRDSDTSEFKFITKRIAHVYSICHAVWSLFYTGSMYMSCCTWTNQPVHYACHAICHLYHTVSFTMTMLHFPWSAVSHSIHHAMHFAIPDTLISYVVLYVPFFIPSFFYTPCCTCYILLSRSVSVSLCTTCYTFSISHCLTMSILYSNHPYLCTGLYVLYFTLSHSILVAVKWSKNRDNRPIVVVS